MKYIVKREKRRRLQFERCEMKQLLCRSILRSSLVSDLVKAQIRRGGLEKTRIHNRCNLTGRGRSISKFFGLSRISVMEQGKCGLLFGLRKGSW